MDGKNVVVTGADDGDANPVALSEDGWRRQRPAHLVTTKEGTLK